jgi:imidazolonepropionase-like amidohydrolase
MLITRGGERIPPRFNTISKDTLGALIAAAHRRGKLAVVHVLTLDFAIDAIDAGADGLEHIFADQKPPTGFAALAKSHGIFDTPTLTAVQSLSNILTGQELARDEHLRPYLSQQDIGQLQSTLPNVPLLRDNRMNYQFAETAVRKLQAGVPLLAGTDAPLEGTVWGASIHRELQLLVQAGLTPSDALASATSVPARIFGLCCGLGDRGRIAAGMRADLLLVHGDPTQDITATRYIVAVWKAGVRCDREAYRHRIVTDVR